MGIYYAPAKIMDLNFTTDDDAPVYELIRKLSALEGWDQEPMLDDIDELPSAEFFLDKQTWFIGLTDWVVGDDYGVYAYQDLAAFDEKPMLDRVNRVLKEMGHDDVYVYMGTIVQ